VPTFSPALWSAIAASFSALSSFVVMMIQRANRLDAARPELVLTGWSRRQEGTEESARDVITFQTIRNVGKGHALDVMLNLRQIDPRQPTATLSTMHLPILAPSEVHEVNGEIIAWWKNVPADKDRLQRLDVTIRVVSTDSLNILHETKYWLLIVPLSSAQGVTDAIAPGVRLLTRTTASRPLWRLRLRNRRRQAFAGVRSLFKRSPQRTSTQ
jgi:hypothetical protein